MVPKAHTSLRPPKGHLEETTLRKTCVAIGRIYEMHAAMRPKMTVCSGLTPRISAQFTDTSEHIRFFFFSCSLFHFLVWFRVVD